MSFSLHFAQNVDSVVISKSSGHLVVIHRKMVLLNAPKFSQSGGINDLEDARLLVLPRDVAGVPLTTVVEQLL